MYNLKKTIIVTLYLQRVRLEVERNGNHLILSQAGPGDSGVYTCQISAYTPTQLSHTVLVRGKKDKISSIGVCIYPLGFRNMEGSFSLQDMAS